MGVLCRSEARGMVIIMNIKIYPGQLHGVVGAVPSKSQAHRALICSALADKPTRIECDGSSGDIIATVACLTALGAEITSDPHGYTVRPLSRSVSDTLSDTLSDNRAVLPCGESGSTLRFLLPVAGALGRSAAFIPEGRLPERPLSPLIDELVRHGCSISRQGSIPLHVSGNLMPGGYIMDAGVSSQFISGLLFALPLLDGDSELRLTGRMESFPYVELTLAMLEMFCVKAEFDGTVFSISEGQAYRSPGVVRIEGDWSNAAFWLGAGAVGGGSITCTGLDLQSRQGDRDIMEILGRFGAHIEASDSSVTVSGGNLRGVEIDARDIPDLVPILAVVAAAADGATMIRNAGRLRDKESDRLAAVASVLGSLGADVRETDDGLVIHGGATLTGGRISSYGDHRIAMAAAIAASVCADAVEISGADAVRKSYPGFFDDLQSLGGRVIIP